MIEISINDNTLHLPSPCTLEQALSAYVETVSGLAVAVNETIVPRQHWGQHKLEAGDQLLVFNAVAGG